MIAHPRIGKIFLASFLAITLVIGSFIVPLQHTPEASADLTDTVKNSTISFSACYGAGILSNYLASKLQGLIGGLASTEVPVAENTQRYKESQADVIARCGARVMFDNSIGSILNVVRQGGRDGGPTYIRNWRNFQALAQSRGEDVFRALASNTEYCDFLKNGINSGFRVTSLFKVSLNGQSTRLGEFDPYTLRARCTLPDGFDVENYQQDFGGNGGWAAFLRMLEPQNNPFGSTILAQDELNKQRQIEVSSDLADAQSGRGNLSIRGSSAADSCLVQGPGGKCIFYKDIKTPGSYIADSLAATVQQELAWMVSVDELNELLETAFTKLAYRMVDLMEAEATPTYAGDEEPPPLCLAPGDEQPEPEAGFKPGDDPINDRQTTLRSQLQSIRSSIANLADESFKDLNKKLIEGLLGDITETYDSGDRTRINLLFYRTFPGTDPAAAKALLNFNKAAILEAIPLENQGSAVTLLERFDEIADRLFTGKDGQDIPPCPEASIPPGPGPGNDQCVIKPPAGQFQYLSAVRTAQSAVAARNPSYMNKSNTDGGAEEYELIGGVAGLDPYHKDVERELQNKGFNAKHDGEEMVINKSGDTFSEHVDITKSCRFGQCVRNAFNNAICRPPAFP